MPGAVITSGARTPIGKLSGALKASAAADLGGVAIAAALQRAGISGDQVDYVIMGTCCRPARARSRRGRRRCAAASR